MAKRKHKKKKKKLVARKPRNLFALAACFRKAGAMINKKKERLKKLSRKKVQLDE